MKPIRPIAWLACAAATVAIALAPAAPAQAQAVRAPWTQASWSQQELDQMLAPIALYPDALLAQVLMAATYPLEVVEADRFVRHNPQLSGDALADAVERMPWDPSVQALTQFPSVLAMMSEHRDWTERLGDAFLAQREQVMDTVQALRARAHAEGTLRSTDQQRVIVQDRVILIEPWQPGLVWVPYYNPLIVFGAWWWPAHPPLLWVPPVAYRPPRFAEVYTVGFVWGPFTAVRTRLWHDPRPVWRDRHVVVTRPGARPPTVWWHDPAHRRGLAYRTPPRDRIGPAPGFDPRHRAMPDSGRDRGSPDRRDGWNRGAPDRADRRDRGSPDGPGRWDRQPPRRPEGAGRTLPRPPEGAARAFPRPPEGAGRTSPRPPEGAMREQPRPGAGRQHPSGPPPQRVQKPAQIAPPPQARPPAQFAQPPRERPPSRIAPPPQPRPQSGAPAQARPPAHYGPSPRIATPARSGDGGGRGQHGQRERPQR